MTDEPTQSDTDISTANVKQKSKGFSAIWIIPLVAALIGGWMVFQNLLQDTAKIEVTFKDAAGLEAGKTVVKVRDIVVGKVTEIHFTKDLGVARVVIEFDGIPPERITDTTRFWVAKPRIGIGGVSGLDTLLSGAYIDADPGKGGKPATKFTGLEEPEIYQIGNPGTRYRLQTAALGSLRRGSPIKYHNITVGQVTHYKLAEDAVNVDIQIFIRAPYDKLVNKNTRFWNISGLELDVGAQGVKLDMPSISSLIEGGIAFTTTDGDGLSSEQAEANSLFTLYEDEGDKDTATAVVFYVPMKVYFKDGVNGLEKGAPVTYKGLRIGTVDEISVEATEDESEILTFAMLRIEPDRLPAKLSFSDDNDEERTERIYQFFEVLAARGLRAQLKIGNLITGKALVLFNYFPNAEQASVNYVDGVPNFTTIPPQSFEGIVQKVDGILAKIDAIPIAKIGNNLAETTTHINAIPMQEIGDNLAVATAKLKAIPTGKISNELSELLQTINALATTLNAAQGGDLGVQTRLTLEEIGRAARALRGMAEYLERHPEALLKGKKSN